MAKPTALSKAVVSARLLPSHRQRAFNTCPANVHNKLLAKVPFFPIHSFSQSSRPSLSVSASEKSFFEFDFPALGTGTAAEPVEGSAVDFKQFVGKVVLVENVATL